MSASFYCAGRSANSPLFGRVSPILLTLTVMLLSSFLAAQTLNHGP